MKVAIDPRVELFSILFHLGGSPEYQFALDTPYRRAVHEYFRAHAHHPAVLESARLRQTHGISHDAPIGLAVYLDRVRLAPIVAIERAELDPRWHTVAAPELEAYLGHVRDFATASNLARFLDEQATYTRAVEERFVRLVDEQQIRPWFDHFLGRMPASFTVVPGLLAGDWSYDARARLASGRENVYMVVSLEAIDEDGLPRPSHLTVTLIVHEMAHAYVNPAVERGLAEIEPAAKRLFELVHRAMEDQAYTSPKLMIDESLVRALTILYLHTKVSEELAHETLVEEERRGFAWMAHLVDLLVPIAATVGRTQQPANIDELIPQLGPFFAEQAKLLEAALAAARPTNPRVRLR